MEQAAEKAEDAGAAADAPAVDDPDARPERDAFAPRLRILNRQSWRGSFRLEEVFWSILEEAAHADGRRLNEYVHDLLGNAPESANKSSLLRAHAARWQRERARAAAAGPPSGLTGAVAASPAACFVMGRDKRIRLFNRSFLEFLRGPGGDVAALQGAAPRMTFERPLPELVEALRQGGGPVAECGLSAVVGRRTLRARARICLIEDHGADDWRIMVFVLKV